MALKLNGSTAGSVSIDAPADTSPTGTDVTLTLPTNAGSSGQVLTTDGSGTLSFTTLASDSISEGNTSAEVVDTGSDGHFKVVTEGTERMRVTSSGTIQLNAASNGSNQAIQFGDPDADNRGLIQYRHGTDALHIYTANSQAAMIDSSGRLLVGTSNIGSSSRNSYYARYMIAGNTSDNTFGRLALKTTRTFDALSSGDLIGDFFFSAAGGEDFASIKVEVGGAPGANDFPGRIVFSTTTDGQANPSEKMKLHPAGYLEVQGVYDLTTSSGANVYVHGNGYIQRSTSSIKYKTDVETLEDSYADALLECRPVWYRSTCTTDDPAYGYWGFIAEEVAEIDPRLVHWKTTNPVHQEDGKIEHVPCEPEAEGVQYDRFVPHLINLVKRQKEQLESQAATIAALDARLTALEGGAS